MNTVENNFDNSSTGINIESQFSYDAHLAQLEWADNFVRIRNSDRLFFFTSYGSNSLDDIVVTFKDELVDNPKRQEKKNFQMAVLWCFSNLPLYINVHWYDGLKELFELSYNYYEPEDFLMAMFEEEYGAKTEDYYKAVNECELLESNFQIADINGYRQGDFATIVYIDNGSWLEAESYFSNLFYDCEVCGNLTINERDFTACEYMNDCYTWDKEDFIKTFLDFEKDYIAKLEKETGNAGYISEWLNNNLPEDLEYH